MSLALPERGSVIRYSYLWADEQAQGREEGIKDRPTLVLALSVITENGQRRVLVLAITHVRPKHASDAVVLPAETKRILGLDEESSWVVTTEANSFIWPGPDIRPVPGRKPYSPFYGCVQAQLLAKIAQSYLANRNRQKTKIVARSA